MPDTLPVNPESRADNPAADEIRDDGTHEAAPDIAYKRLAMVNIVYYGLAATEALKKEAPENGSEDLPAPVAVTREGIVPDGTAFVQEPPVDAATLSPPGNWVLIDTGIPGGMGQIVQAAEDRFGKGARPACILLTHGHFDHVGNLVKLAERWDVPIYAHKQEMPFLDGTLAYEKPDPLVGGGLMPLLSPLFPRGPVDVSQWLQPLPEDGSVPGMSGWRWIHTPGHTPGHVSFWRDSDRSLIVGDAFITTKQESAYAVATQKTEIHGPPAYFTPDWDSARESVRKLATLEPELVVSGHGRALHGSEMRSALETLARDFDSLAIPDHAKRSAT